MFLKVTVAETVDLSVLLLKSTHSSLAAAAFSPAGSRGRFSSCPRQHAAKKGRTGGEGWGLSGL